MIGIALASLALGVVYCLATIIYTLCDVSDGKITTMGGAWGLVFKSAWVVLAAHGIIAILNVIHSTHQ